VIFHDGVFVGAVPEWEATTFVVASPMGYSFTQNPSLEIGI